MAMHLMFRKRQDANIQLPESLPVELSLSASDEEVSQP